jgi:hypothetical protein
MACKSARRRARADAKAFSIFLSTVRVSHERWNDTIRRAEKAWATGEPVEQAKPFSPANIPAWIENGDW